MAHFSDTINDGVDSQPVPEKLRCLGAIREMLKLAKNYISNGLPQVMKMTASIGHRTKDGTDIGMLAIGYPNERTM